MRSEVRARMRMKRKVRVGMRMKRKVQVGMRMKMRMVLKSLQACLILLALTWLHQSLEGADVMMEWSQKKRQASRGILEQVL